MERLEAEAARLSAAAELHEGAVLPGGVAREMTAQADRLSALAARLLKQAHLAIIADDMGRLRYGNRLLRDRLAQRPEGSEKAVGRMAGCWHACPATGWW